MPWKIGACPSGRGRFRFVPSDQSVKVLLEALGLPAHEVLHQQGSDFCGHLIRPANTHGDDVIAIAGDSDLLAWTEFFEDIIDGDMGGPDHQHLAAPPHGLFDELTDSRGLASSGGTPDQSKVLGTQGFSDEFTLLLRPGHQCPFQARVNPGIIRNLLTRGFLPDVRRLKHLL